MWTTVRSLMGGLALFLAGIAVNQFAVINPYGGRAVGTVGAVLGLAWLAFKLDDRFPKPNWLYRLAAGAVVLTGGWFTWWGLGPLLAERADQPVAEAKLENHYGHYFVRVRNLGTWAEFHAQIEFEQPAVFQSRETTYEVFWEDTGGPVASIAPGSQNRIHFAASDPQFRLFLEGDTVGVYVLLEWGPETDSVRFRLRLTSRPRMKGDSLVLAYLVSKSGGLEAVEMKP
jgi:hypothetical protein